MPRKNLLDRRDFLKTSAAVGATVAAGGVWSQQAAAEPRAANEKLNIACIGTGNQAGVNNRAVRHEAITVLCDVDKTFLDVASRRYRGARTYVDFREMLEKESDKIDAVVVSTADHTHALASLSAIRKGLHVYCEKPLSHTVHEARLVAEAANEHGVATQLGTQKHASDHFRRIVEIIQSGAIGDVTEVHVWTGTDWGGDRQAPDRATAPPATLDWDLWLGPASERPFVEGRYHPREWRRWWDFGQGTLGDIACHYMDLPFWALKLRHPIWCEAEGPPADDETCPNGLVVRYAFPNRKAFVTVNLTWYDGSRVPQNIGSHKVSKDGMLFVGNEGEIFADYDGYHFYPQEKFEGYEPPKPTIAASIGHHAEWIKACKEGTPTTCNFDYSGALTEAVLLGNVAYRVGKRLDWSAETLSATGCPAADKFIRKQYRSGWEVA